MRFLDFCVGGLMSKIDMSWIPAGIWNEDMRARTPCCLLRSDNGPSKDDEKSDHRLTLATSDFEDTTKINIVQESFLGVAFALSITDHVMISRKVKKKFEEKKNIVK